MNFRMFFGSAKYRLDFLIAAGLPLMHASIVDKPKEEETVKAEPCFASSYMTVKQDNNENNNVNPFAIGTAVWQSFMTYWLNAYGEFLKNAPKMTEQWYNAFWKPWVNWMSQQQERQNRD